MSRLACLFFALHLLCHISAQEDLKFKEVTGDDQSVQIICVNSSPATYSVRFEFRLKGMTSDLADGEIVVVEANQEKHIATLIPTASQWGYGFSSDYVMGDISAQHDDDYVYTLPFATNSRRRVMQGYFGKFSHQGSRALDWEMDEGTPVHCMREGIVVDIREDSQVGCANPRCLDQANFIKIEHIDGTLADYAHLLFEGAEVVRGQKVSAGDLIGYSGNTGWSSGAHLHTKVFTSTFSRRPEGIETRFRIQNESVLPEQGRSYGH